MGDTSIPGIEILTPEEGIELFDQQARKFLGMSGEEFLRRYDAGEFRPSCQSLNVARMVMLIPLARRTDEKGEPMSEETHYRATATRRQWLEIMELMLQRGHEDEHQENCLYDFADGIAYELCYAVEPALMDDILTFEVRDDIEQDFIERYVKEQSGEHEADQQQAE